MYIWYSIRKGTSFFSVKHNRVAGEEKRLLKP